MVSVLKPHILNILCTNQYVYAQIYRVADRHIVVSASSLQKAVREGLANTSNKEASAKVGRVLAERALAAEVPAVSWKRRRRQKFHGKVAELLTSMQQAGLPLH